MGSIISEKVTREGQGERGAASGEWLLWRFAVICSSFWMWCYGEGKEALNFDTELFRVDKHGCGSMQREPRCCWALTWWQWV